MQKREGNYYFRELNSKDKSSPEEGGKLLFQGYKQQGQEESRGGGETTISGI